MLHKIYITLRKELPPYVSICADMLVTTSIQQDKKSGRAMRWMGLAYVTNTLIK